MSRHSQYPRFFIRDAQTPVQKIAKAETPEEAALYTESTGWREYGLMLSGGVHVGQNEGHTLGLSVEGE